MSKKSKIHFHRKDAVKNPRDHGMGDNAMDRSVCSSSVLFLLPYK